MGGCDQLGAGLRVHGCMGCSGGSCCVLKRRARLARKRAEEAGLSAGTVARGRRHLEELGLAYAGKAMRPAWDELGRWSYAAC